MPAEEAEVVTWTGDSNRADQGKRPSPRPAYPKMHLQWLCTGWLVLVKTNRGKKGTRENNEVHRDSP